LPANNTQGRHGKKDKLGQWSQHEAFWWLSMGMRAAAFEYKRDEGSAPKVRTAILISDVDGALPNNLFLPAQTPELLHPRPESEWAALHFSPICQLA